MRRYAFPAALILALALAALVAWAWSTDYFLKSKCTDAHGAWNADTRVCEITLPPVQAATASLRR